MKENKLSYLKQWFFWPSKNIVLVIPLILLAGFLTGIWIDTGSLKQMILPITMLMIYPTMIGFRGREVFNFNHGKLLLTVMGLNFLIIPLIAYLLGTGFLLAEPQLFAGLAITALLPTSNMTIAFTMLAKGNVPASIKMTTTGLLLGSFLAPWYLYLMVGKYVPVDILLTLKTIALVILIPLILGMLTYDLLMKRYSQEQFQKKIKPYLPAASTWGLLLIIFISMSMNARRILQHLDVFAIALGVQLLFYGANYLLSILVGRKLFKEKDALTLVFSTVLRNLSISIGLAATAFGANAALMVSLAFLIQAQASAWFIKINEKRSFFEKPA
ncbi:arsenic resistance protein [Desulfitobacterium chlororespirans]|uniref:Arsenite efflux pump ArsB, ACR3 family n=1 Tax=Desulfitobacterium chlororespirans DSM 11544 TaxID=1121395 RepID=A0A1M7U4X3_9FIRM|nr:bile acid:sodium symporter [Desulfitobacterium chlororespirans]SHN78142.1 Arsenite efflux pump ArsB, ACR3 family [Desulfitobacterium chlororespirans DSM 11544]